MATVIGVAPLQMADINFNRVAAGGIGATTYANLNIGGIVYPTVVEVDWTYNGATYASLYAGTGIVASYPNNFLSITAGVVNAYFEVQIVNNQFSVTWAVEGINYSAVSLYNASLTTSTTDDFQIITSVLAGADTIIGSSGNDFLYGWTGNDSIDGGAGSDGVSMKGKITDYVISNNNGVITAAGPSGTTTLQNIERAYFDDKMLIFDLHSSQDLLVYKIYQAAYGRTPDGLGFAYWATVADSTGMSATTIADQFLAAAEFTQVYGANPSNTTYVTGLYTHVLGRAPDQGGLDYWVGLANGGMAKDALLVAFATSAENANLIGSHASATTGYWTTWN